MIDFNQIKPAVMAYIITYLQMIHSQYGKLTEEQVKSFGQSAYNLFWGTQPELQADQGATVELTNWLRSRGVDVELPTLEGNASAGGAPEFGFRPSQVAYEPAGTSTNREPRVSNPPPVLDEDFSKSIKDYITGEEVEKAYEIAKKIPNGPIRQEYMEKAMDLERRYDRQQTAIARMMMRKKGAQMKDNDVEIRSEMARFGEVNIPLQINIAKLAIEAYVRVLEQTNPGLNDAGAPQTGFEIYYNVQAPDEVKNDPDILMKIVTGLQEKGFNVSMPSGSPSLPEGDIPQGAGVGGREREEEPQILHTRPSEPNEKPEPLPSMGKEHALPPWKVGRRENIYEFEDGTILSVDLPRKNFKQFAEQFDYATTVWQIENNVDNFAKFLGRYGVNAHVLSEQEKGDYLVSQGGHTRTEDGDVVPNANTDREKNDAGVAFRKELRKLIRPNISKDEVRDKIIDIGLKMKGMPEGPEKADLQRQMDNFNSQLETFEYYEASRKNNLPKTGGNMNRDKIVKEGSVGRRGLSSLMESFVEVAKKIVTAKTPSLGPINSDTEAWVLFQKKYSELTPEEEKTVQEELAKYPHEEAGASNFPEHMAMADAKAMGFFKKAKSCGWGTFAMDPLDGGAGGIWFTEKGDDGKDYLVKQVTQEGEVVRRFKEKQASLVKKADKKTCVKCNTEFDPYCPAQTKCESCEKEQPESGNWQDKKQTPKAPQDRSQLQPYNLTKEDHEKKVKDWMRNSSENKDRGIFTVYTKKPVDMKGSALGEKEAKKEKGVFQVYKSKPAENVEKKAILSCPQCKEEMETVSQTDFLEKGQRPTAEYYCNRCEEYFDWARGSGLKKRNSEKPEWDAGAGIER